MLLEGEESRQGSKYAILENNIKRKNGGIKETYLFLFVKFHLWKTCGKHVEKYPIFCG